MFAQLCGLQGSIPHAYTSCHIHQQSIYHKHEAVKFVFIHDNIAFIQDILLPFGWQFLFPVCQVWDDVDNVAGQYHCFPGAGCVELF